MDTFIQAGIPKRWLLACNRCRIFLRAVAISDISNPMGMRIPQVHIECRNRLPSKLEWPNQARPSRHNRTIWKRALSKVFLNSDKFRTLRSTLGRWFPDPSLHHREYVSGVTCDEKYFFHWNCSGWRSYRILSRFPNYATRQMRQHRVLPPEFIIPAEIATISQEAIFFRPSHQELTPQLHPDVPVVTWSPSTPVPTAVVKVILHASSCQCECFYNNKKCSRHVNSPGKSYNTLVRNVLWAIRVLKTVPERVSKLRIESNFSLKRLEANLQMDGQDYRRVIHAEAAAEAEIRASFDDVRSSITFHTVESEEFWESGTQEEDVPWPEQVSMIYQGAPSHRYKALLIHLPAGQAYRMYLSRKYDLVEVWDDIDWLAFRRAMPKYSNRSPALIKYLHGWLATSKNVQKRGPFEIKGCPFCNEPETTAHLFQCCAPRRRQVIQTHVTSLWSKAEPLLGQALTFALRQHLSTWINREEVTLTESFEAVLQQQYEIGWCQFVQGRVSIRIRKALEAHLLQCGHKNPVHSALNKTKKFLHILWDSALSLWTTRNTAAATTIPEQPSIQRQKWEAMASYFYRKQHKFLEEDRRSVFSKTLTHLLQSTEKQLACWCTQVHRAFHASAARRIKRTQECHRALTDFFTATARPPGATRTL